MTDGTGGGGLVKSYQVMESQNLSTESTWYIKEEMISILMFKIYQDVNT